MAFNILNEADAFDPAQAEPDKVDFDILAAGAAGTGVVSGCTVSAQGVPDMTVAVAAGVASVAGVPHVVAAGNVVVGAADPADPRFDLVVVDDTGAKSAVAGVPAPDVPVFPAIPADSAVLAAVYVPAAATEIVAAQIVDKRVLVLGLGTNVAAFLGDPSSANLLAALTTKTGTEKNVFSDSPAFTTQISTPKIITASGALDITPAAGSDLNVNLSTTGDFVLNTNQLYVDTSTGRIGIGTLNAPTNATTVVPKLVAAGTGVNQGFQFARLTSPGGGGAIGAFCSTRGSDVDIYTILQNGDGIGSFYFLGADGVQFQPAVQLVAQVDSASIAANAMYGRFIISTAGGGGSNAVAEALRIDSSQNTTLSGTLITRAPTTAKPGFRLPGGSAPTSKTSGDFWYDGSNLKFQNGVTTQTLSWT